MDEQTGDITYYCALLGLRCGLCIFVLAEATEPTQRLQSPRLFQEILYSNEICHMTHTILEVALQHRAGLIPGDEHPMLR